MLALRLADRTNGDRPTRNVVVQKMSAVIRTNKKYYVR
jgi:hypothetical protein